MSLLVRVAAVGVLAASLTGCGEASQARAAEAKAMSAQRLQAFQQRVAEADANPGKANEPLAEWVMPSFLREISGLALTTRGTVLTHDDNMGRISEIDPRTGVLLKSFALSGNQKGDFEAIAIAGTDIYLLESSGKLFKFQEAADGKQVPFTVYDTKLGKECEFESLTYQADSSRLLMACKRIHDKEAGKEVRIYILPLPLGNRMAMTTMSIPMDDVIGKNGWKNFHPSDATIDPSTGNYVLIASREKAYVVITPDGDVVRSGPLPGDHRQAEGLAITKDSIMIVSDEANVRPPKITLYRWRP
ncbi:MAG TPA: hypothetical protein VJ840_16550 [Gemmatimonadaceae bacterium]|nr:hypothetical protein [Gemmatimonadaceae bacterium]